MNFIGKFNKSWRDIFESTKIYDGPSLLLNALKLSELEWISYDYLVSDPSIEGRFKDIMYIDHKKAKRMNRKKILDEIIGKPLAEMGFCLDVERTKKYNTY